MDAAPVRWADFAVAAPDLAVRVAARLAARRHLIMATLRADGSPRLCGTEARLVAGELELGAMAGTARLDDLRRDPRIALHSGSDEPPDWSGDATVSGVVLLVGDPAARSAHLAAGAQGEMSDDWVLLRIRISEALHVGLAPSCDHLIVESWRPGRGLRRHER